MFGIWKKIKRFFWTAFIRRNCGKCGEALIVNGKSCVNKKTYLGHHVNMNGMEIKGNGEVYIGNYFHSGTECKIITSNHNYDKGESIPYDKVRIEKT